MTNGLLHIKGRDSDPPPPPSGYFVFYVRNGEYCYRKPDGTIVSANTVSLIKMAELSYQLPQNASGHTIPALTWTTVPLNTKVSDPNNIVAMLNNQFTLIPGMYIISVFIPMARNSSSTVVGARIQNVSNGTMVSKGVVSTLQSSVYSVYSMMCTLTTDGTNTYALQVFGSAGIIIGYPMNQSVFGEEIYVKLLLQKVE